jgi:hypothetical protein
MVHYLRYFLALSLISTTISAQDAAAVKSDKTTIARLGQSMKDFTKRIKRYYACAMGKCSQQETQELKEHIWSDGAILVAGIAAMGVGTYLIHARSKKLNRTDILKMFIQGGRDVLGYNGPSLQDKLPNSTVTVENGGVVITYQKPRPSKEAFVTIAKKIIEYFGNIDGRRDDGLIRRYGVRKAVLHGFTNSFPVTINFLDVKMEGGFSQSPREELFFEDHFVDDIFNKHQVNVVYFKPSEF